jgi:hypothetical protein
VSEFPLKPITKNGVAAALEKAERYRLINDPSSAESICLDVLAVDPENQQALVTLILAISDQSEEAPAAAYGRAMEALPRLTEEYKRVYYEGLICERRAKAHLAVGSPNVGEVAYDWLRRAMEHYERAEKIRPPGNDEPILRWNTCVRILERGKQHLRPSIPQEYEPSFE